MEAIIALLLRLRRDPDDAEAASVVADWCEQHGFLFTASILRAPATRDSPLREDYLRAIWTLASLFGVETTIFNRYTVVIGLPRIAVQSTATESLRPTAIIETSMLLPFRLRRLVVASTAPSSWRQPRSPVDVEFVQVGPEHLFDSVDAVPGDIFQERSGFDTFDFLVDPLRPIRVGVTNLTDSDVEVSGCLLGDRLPMGPIDPLARPVSAGTGGDDELVDDEKR